MAENGKKPPEEENRPPVKKDGGKGAGTPRSPFSLQESLSKPLANDIAKLLKGRKPKKDKTEPKASSDRKDTQKTTSTEEYQEQVRKGHDSTANGGVWASKDEVEGALPKDTAPEPAPQTPSENGEDSIETDKFPIVSESELNFAGMKDKDLQEYFNNWAEENNITSLGMAKLVFPQLVAEVEKRPNLLAVEGDGVGRTSDSKNVTRVDLVAQDPETIKFDQGAKKAAEQNSQPTPSPKKEEKPKEPEAAPEPSPAPPPAKPVQTPPAEPQEKSPASPLNKSPIKWQRYKSYLLKCIEHIETETNPQLRAEAIERGKKSYHMIVHKDLAEKHGIDPETIEDPRSLKYLKGKPERGEELTPIDEVVLLLGRLRSAIEKHSPEEIKEEPVSEPAPEVSVAPPQPEPVQAEAEEEEALDIRLPENGGSRVGRKIKSFLFNRMTVAVVLGAAVSYLMHAVGAFEDLAAGIQKFWNDVFTVGMQKRLVQLPSIKVTAQQAMAGFYAIITTILTFWFIGKLGKRTRLKEAVEDFKERHESEHAYVKKALEEIRDTSPDDDRAQSINLAKAMVDDEELFGYIDMFYNMSDEETGESVIADITGEVGLEPKTISNFYMAYEFAEKTLMVERLERLADLPERMRRDKLRELLDEDMFFSGRFLSLIEKNEDGKYTNKERMEYLPLDIGHTKGGDLLRDLEKDYNHMEGGMSS